MNDLPPFLGNLSCKHDPSEHTRESFFGQLRMDQTWKTRGKIEQYPWKTQDSNDVQIIPIYTYIYNIIFIYNIYMYNINIYNINIYNILIYIILIYI